MKKCVKALSVLLATLMLLSTVVVGAAAESSAIVVNGTELIITDWVGVKNDTLGNPTKGEAYLPVRDTDPLVPELPSTRLTFGWNKEESNFETLEKIYEDNAAAKVYRYNDSIVVGTDFVYNDINSGYFIDIYNGGNSKGLMFYIKLHENSEQTNIYLEGLTVGFNEDGTVVTASGKVTQVYNSIIKDKDVYLMPAGANSWDEAVIGALGNGEKKNSQSICLDGGFEGWVYIPAASWINSKASTSNYLYRVNWYVNRLVDGEDFQISNLMVVDGDVTAADGVKVGDTEFIFDNNRYYSTTALNVGGVSVSKGDIYGVATQEGQIAPSYGAANTSFNPTLLIDSLSERINPASLYKATVAGTTLVQNLDAAKRPKDNTGWSFFDIAAAGIEGRNLYRMSFKPISPFVEGSPTVYDPATTNSKINNKTYGDQFKEIFGVDSTDETPTAYVGGAGRMIGYSNNGGANFYAGVNPQNLADASMSMVGKSVLVYVERTYNEGIVAADEDMKAALMLGNYSSKVGCTYYLYENNKWQKNDFVSDVGSDKGAVELDKNFKGWIMVPASSMYNGAQSVTEWAEFRFSPGCLGDIYGDVIFGDIAVLDFEDPFSVASGSQFVSANENALVDNFPFEQPMVKTADAATRSEGGVNGFKDANNKALLTLSDKTFTADANFAPPITKPEGSTEVFYEAAGLTRVGFKNDGAALTAQNNKSFAFKVDNSKGGDLEAIFGSNYLYMSPDVTYYLLGEGDTEWTAREKTSTSTYTLTVGSNVKQKKVASITIPEGFVGWVSVPFKYLTVGNNPIQNASREFVRLDFHPVKMTGSLTINGLALFSTEVPSVWYYDNGICKDMNNSIGVLPEYSADNEKYITVENGVLSTNYDGLYANLKASGSIAADGALMFYAKNGSENAVSFKTSIGDVNTAKAYTKGGVWTSVAANGVITLNAGFEGWVKVAVEDAVEFEAIKLIFTSLTDGLALSDFMTVNQKDDLYKIKNGTQYATDLFYAQGDFNTDGFIDICDLVTANNNTIKHDDTKFDTDDQERALRNYILNN